MNFFRKLFGGKKKETQKPLTRPSDEVDALVKLRSTEQFLMTRRETLDTNIKKELATIKQNVITNKRVALNALKRKNCYEKQSSQIEGILLTVMQQRLALESVNTNTLPDAMETTSNTVKMVNQNINIDDIHNMIDDIEKSHGVTQEVSEAFSNSDTLEVDENEEELQKELENLELEELNGQEQSLKELENLELEELDEQVMNMDQILAVNYPLPVMPTFESLAQIKKTSGRRNSMMT